MVEPTGTAPPGAPELRDLVGRAPRIELMDVPTPLQPLPRLSADLGVQLWAKRDDLGGTGLGGNKLRKLEYLLGAAIAEGADTVVTFGALQSNHARQCAAACARVGLRCHLVLTRTVQRHDEWYSTSGNVLLDELFGAEVHSCDPDDASVLAAISAVEAAVAAEGGTARWIPPGGSEPIGALGYVRAGLELAAQVEELGLDLERVVVATSTGGTHAGLCLGLEAAGVSAGGRPSEVTGVAVYQPAAPTEEAVRLLGAGVLDLVGADTALWPAASSPVVLGDQLGEGYGRPTPAMREAMATLARSEGIVADPVYSAKALAAVFAGCRNGSFGSRGVVVWLHTGGSPAVFAYGRDAFETNPTPTTKVV